MDSDCILLKKMVFFGYHGAYAAERELGQRFVVDLALGSTLLLRAAATASRTP